MNRAMSAHQIKYLDMNVARVHAIKMEIMLTVLSWVATTVHPTHFNENHNQFSYLLKQQQRQQQQHRKNQMNAFPEQDGKRIVIGAIAHQLASVHVH